MEALVSFQAKIYVGLNGGLVEIQSNGSAISLDYEKIFPNHHLEAMEAPSMSSAQPGLKHL